MRLERLEFRNFKGIRKAEIEIVTCAPGNVITLIGLNESGKTTVLEAISHFVSVDNDTSRIVETVAPKQRPVDLIPKSEKSNFTGEISIRAHLIISDEDVESVRQVIAEKHKASLETVSFPRKIEVARRYLFEDSDFTKQWNTWTCEFKYADSEGERQSTYGSVDNKNTRLIWDTATDHLRVLFPKIVYFPTFLFSIPNRIYLEDIPSVAEDSEEAISNRYFRQVLQDVADSLGGGLSIQKHIVDRISRKRAGYANPLAFFTALLQMDEASLIKAVVNRLAGAITNTVFKAWNEIFDYQVSGKTVRIDWGVDAEKGNIPYLQINIFDGEQSYTVSERSLGFRWFFTFLLFTQFRKSRSDQRGTIFLFDEPASNLHARAQTKLLESFGRTAQNDQFIIYSTHSHYMIDPMKLEKAYIVENKSIDFEAKDAGTRFESEPTDISLTRYRRFVASYPNRVSYFQPALDALKFSFGPLELQGHMVIVEGKFDFHPLKYFQARTGKLPSVMIVPAPSASEAGTLVSLLRGMATRFVVLLDDDRAGKAAYGRYLKHHLLSDDQICTLSDLNSKMRGQAFEAVYSPEVKALAKADGKPSKGELSLLLQRLCIENDFSVDLGRTTEDVSALLDGLSSKLSLSVKKRLSRVRRRKTSH